MDILNFISWIKGKRVVTTVDPAKTLLPLGLKDGRRDDEYLAGAITVEDFAASIVTPPAYKVYTALLTQTGTDAPVAIVLENTLGYNITWGYDNVGVYTATGITNTFANDKFAFIQGAGNSSSLVSLWAYNIAGPPNNTLILECYDLGNVGGGSFDLKDNILINQFIEIRVYN
jgi:hypothetical protein